MILITDGEHRMEEIGSSRTETEDERSKRDSKLRKYLEESGIKVYAIGITSELDTGENRRLRAENFLIRLTKETGGRVVFSRSKRVEIDKLVNQLLQP
jgi:cell division GTPase FtsZ